VTKFLQLWDVAMTSRLERTASFGWHTQEASK